MTPRLAFADLISRTRALLCAVVLTLIAGASLIVAAAFLFCTIWISIFTTARTVADRQIEKYRVKEVVE